MHYNNEWHQLLAFFTTKPQDILIWSGIYCLWLPLSVTLYLNTQSQSPDHMSFLFKSKSIPSGWQSAWIHSLICMFRWWLQECINMLMNMYVQMMPSENAWICSWICRYLHHMQCMEVNMHENKLAAMIDISCLPFAPSDSIKPEKVIWTTDHWSKCRNHKAFNTGEVLLKTQRAQYKAIIVHVTATTPVLSLLLTHYY